jgi:hypothetical protein
MSAATSEREKLGSQAIYCDRNKRKVGSFFNSAIVRKKRHENFAHLSAGEEVLQTVTSVKLSATSPLDHTEDAFNKDALH